MLVFKENQALFTDTILIPNNAKNEKKNKTKQLIISAIENRLLQKQILSSRQN